MLVIQVKRDRIIINLKYGDMIEISIGYWVSYHFLRVVYTLLIDS